MKPSPFRYLKPESLEETLGYLDEWGSECAPLAGGQSLVPLINFRVARPEVLIDLDGLDELRGIEVDDLGATIGAMASHTGTREVPAEAFFRGPFVTAREPGELVTAVRFPPQSPGRCGVAFLEFTRGHRGLALAGVAATVSIRADGTIEDAQLALAGVGPCPIRVAAAADLRGQLPAKGVFEGLAREVRRTVEP